jgi:tRNA(Ile)-lysidine synthase
LERKSGRRKFSTVEFGDSKFDWKILSRNQIAIPEKQIGQEFFDADKVGAVIILRHWRAGDRFQPIGFSSPTKLQDLFVNAKIPAAQRHVLILATTLAGEIFWVAGLRISENFKLTRATRRRLVWRWHKLS